MAITAADIKWYLSGGGGNTDPNASLGGTISSTEITDDTLNNLFDNVSGDEASSGDTEYRAIYIKNTHGTLQWMSVKAWIQTNTPGDDSITIAKDDAKGSPNQSVVNESTAPSDPTLTFVTAVDKANGLDLGNLDAGDVYQIWIKRVVPGSCAPYTSNSFVLKVEGDTAA